MISHKYSCIFVHIPKCAGTSIEAALGHLDHHTGRGGQDHRPIRWIEKPFWTAAAFSSRENIREVYRRVKNRYVTKVQNPRNKIAVSKEQYQAYFKFSIVRNPWARAFSWYKNVMRDEIHLQEYGIKKDLSFREFLTSFVGQRMLRPQIYWLKSFDGSISLDYIGRFENLKEDVDEIFARLGLPSGSLPHEIKGPEDDYRKYYDEGLHDVVLSVYKEEIGIFGYSFEN